MTSQRTDLKAQILSRDQDRRDALHYYGGDPPACACCGATDSLEIDHLDGGGTQHRAQIAPQSLEAWLKAEGYPDGFQILCHPCNLSKNDGTTCTLDHGNDSRSDSSEIQAYQLVEDGNTPEPAVDKSREPIQSDPLVKLQTRVPQRVKDRIQKEATARGVATGVIIAEWSQHQESAIALLHRLEAKVDRLLIRQSKRAQHPAHTASDASSPETPSFDYLQCKPWAVPQQVPLTPVFSDTHHVSDERPPPQRGFWLSLRRLVPWLGR